MKTAAGASLKRLIAPAAVFLLLLFSAPAHAKTTDVTVGATAAVAPVVKCNMSIKELDLDMGLLDPENPVDVKMQTTISFVCTGNAEMPDFRISYAGAGGDFKLRSPLDPNRFLTYRLEVSRSYNESHMGVEHLLRLSFVVPGSSYKEAAAGPYKDTVYLTITP